MMFCKMMTVAAVVVVAMAGLVAATQSPFHADNEATGKGKLDFHKDDSNNHEYHNIQAVKNFAWTEDHTAPLHKRRFTTHEETGEQVRVNHKGHYMPHGDKIGVHMTAHGQTFEFDAPVNHNLMRHDTKHFFHHGVEGEEMTTKHPRVSSYLLETHHTHASMNIATHQGPSVHAGGRHILSGLIYRDGVIYEMQHMSQQKYYMPADLYERMTEEARPHGGYVMWILGTEDEKQMSLNWVSQRHYEKMGMAPSMNHRRVLQLEIFQNCFENQNIARNFAMSIAGDVGYVNALIANGENELDRTKLFLADVSFLYSRQMNIYVELAASQLMTQPGGAVWNNQQPCNQDISAKLNAFRSWMNANNGANKQLTTGGSSTWHLMTNCYPPPGTVGLASLAGGCSSTSASGVNTLFSRTSLTVAHELGHNFNANHSFENGQGTTYGIMDYGDGKYLGVYQFHRSLRQNEMCAWVRWAQTQGLTPCFSVRPAEVTEVAANVDNYAYVASATSTACSVTCGAGTISTPMVCQKTTTTSTGAAVAGGVSIVEDTYCVGTNKPAALRSNCNLGACPSIVDSSGARTTASCGGHGECMSGTCCSGCFVDKQTPSCIATDPVRDAIAVNTMTNKVLHFRGKEYSQFATMTATAPDAGYPRAISDLPGLPSALHADIDAICSRSGGVVEIFKGKQYWEYVFGSGMSLGYPRAISDFGVPSTWDSVHAAVGTPTECFLYHKGDYVVYDFTTKSVDGTKYPLPISSFTTRVVGDKVVMIDAAVGNGKDLFQLHKAGSMWGIQRNDLSIDHTGDTPLLGSTSRTPATGNAVGCQVFNCRQCSSSSSYICADNSCDTGFKLVRDGSRCTADDTIVELLFDSQGDKYDASFITQMNSSGWGDGRVSKAVKLGESDMIHMNPIGALEQFDVTMSIKPNAGVTKSKQTLFHADGLTGMHDNMGHVHVQLLPSSGDTTGKLYKVTIKVGEIDVTTTADLSSDDFSIVKAGVTNGNMYVETNGQRQSVSFQTLTDLDGTKPIGDQTSETVKVIRFDTWRIGAHTTGAKDGYEGHMDSFAIMSSTADKGIYTNSNAGSSPTNSSSGKSEDNSDMLMFVVIAATALLLLVGVGITCWCCMRRNSGGYESADRSADISFGSSSRL